MKPEIKNIKKAALRIVKAVEEKEPIIIYGDADLDGISASIILKESIKILKGEAAELYFPDREKEGYGISEFGLNYLKKYAPCLFVALDCGIGNFRELKIAKTLGFEAIVIDHHEILEKLPQASIIVDPKQKGDKYPFKYFATVGLSFKLSEYLLGDKMTGEIKKSFLELVALATIADMMPKVSENDIMISDGLNSLSTTWRPGLQALLGLRQFKDLSLMDKVYKMNSLMNIRDVKNRLPAAYRLLTSETKEKAGELAEILFKKGIERKERVREMLAEMESIINGKPKEAIIFEGEEEWEIALLGVVSSLLVQRYGRPTFLYKKGKEDSQGGCRAPEGLNLVEAMKGYSKKFITYGGHPQAGGFRIKNENLEGLKKHLAEYFEKKTQ